MGPVSTPSVERHLPLKPAVFHILLALADREAHGYAIMQTVRAQSEGRVRLATGPFYRHLRALLDSGFVAESGRRPSDDDPRRGTYYRLTRLGRAAVQAESERLAHIVTLTEKLGLLPGAG